MSDHKKKKKKIKNIKEKVSSNKQILSNQMELFLVTSDKKMNYF